MSSGRLVRRQIWTIPGLYQLALGRRSELWEGSFVGNIARIDPDAMSADIELFCEGGLALPISVTIYDRTWLIFTAPRDDGEIGELHPEPVASEIPHLGFCSRPTSFIRRMNKPPFGRSPFRSNSQLR